MDQLLNKAYKKILLQSHVNTAERPEDFFYVYFKGLYLSSHTAASDLQWKKGLCSNLFHQFPILHEVSAVLEDIKKKGHFYLIIPAILL